MKKVVKTSIQIEEDRQENIENAKICYTEIKVSSWTSSAIVKPI